MVVSCSYLWVCGLGNEGMVFLIYGVANVKKKGLIDGFWWVAYGARLNDGLKKLL